MGKQHQTFPGEPEEMPDEKLKPEIEQPNDPKQPEIPPENLDEIPTELPPDKSGDHNSTTING
jgi:hypothetical protein